MLEAQVAEETELERGRESKIRKRNPCQKADLVSQRQS